MLGSSVFPLADYNFENKIPNEEGARAALDENAASAGYAFKDRLRRKKLSRACG